MQRHDILSRLRELKLYGMAAAYDETVVQGSRRQRSIQEILSDLCVAERTERNAPSISYQMRIARFPVQKNLESFDFSGSQVNEQHLRELADGPFLDEPRNLVFIGGTGTGKTHIAGSGSRY